MPKSKLMTSERRCLRCGRTFPSVSPGNRICRYCKTKNGSMFVPRKSSKVMPAAKKAKIT